MDSLTRQAIQQQASGGPKVRRWAGMRPMIFMAAPAASVDFEQDHGLDAIEGVQRQLVEQLASDYHCRYRNFHDEIDWP